MPNKVKIRFPDEEFQCLSEQLVRIINSIKTSLKDCYWIVGDIEIASFPTKKGNLYQADKKLQLFTNLNELIKKIKIVEQYDWGVFIAMPNEKKVDLDKVKLYAEVDEDQEMQIEGALVEIIIFDGGFFEVLSNERGIIEKLKDLYE